MKDLLTTVKHSFIAKSSRVRDIFLILANYSRCNFGKDLQIKADQLLITDFPFKLHISTASRYSLYKFGILARLNFLASVYSLDKVSLDSGDYVINVGSNIGELAVVCSMQGANVIAIEGDLRNLKALNANAAIYNFQSLNYVLADAHKQVTLFSDFEHANSSIINESGSANKVFAVPLDSISEINQLSSIKLIIGDVEGAEPELLLGAKDILQRTEYISLDCGKERNGMSTIDRCKKILLSEGWQILVKQSTGRYNLLACNPSLRK